MMYNSSAAMYDGNIESYYIYNNVQSDQSRQTSSDMHLEQNSNDTYTSPEPAFKSELVYPTQINVDQMTNHQRQQQQHNLDCPDNSSYSSNNGNEHQQYYYPLQSDTGSPDCCPASLNQQEQR